MSDTEAENEKVIQLLEECLKEMPQYLRLFSMSMRALYSGASPHLSREFTKLRDNTRDDAKLYLKVIFPLTTKFVCATNDFFEYYSALSFKEWCDSLPDIRKDITANKDLAETLLKMYEDFIVPLKKRQGEASNIMETLKCLQTEYDKATKSLEAKSKTRRNWAFALAFIPLVNVIATPLLLSYAKEDSKKAVAAIKESAVHEAAALVVKETLVPALDCFIEGLLKAAGFFQTMELEMTSLEKRATEIKLVHYKIVTNKVKELILSCHEFYMALPAVRTDFEAIPDGDTQKNYVEKWLEEKLKEIQKRKKSTQERFEDIVKGIQGISLEFMMVSSSLEPTEHAL